MPNNHPTLKSLFDDCADAIREQKGDAKNVKYSADDFPSLIRSINSCNHMLQNECGVASGSFVTSSNKSTVVVTIEPPIAGVAPYIITLWAMNPCSYDGNIPKPYTVGATLLTIRNPSGKQSRCHSWYMTGLAASDNAALQQGNYNAIRYNINDNTITFSGNPLYPLRAGITYCWEARWLSQTEE